MKKLGIKSVIIRKCKPMVKKQEILEKFNILKRNFNTTAINQKWVT